MPSGNMLPYIISYVHVELKQYQLTYLDGVWMTAVGGVVSSVSMLIGGLVSRKIGLKVTTLLGCVLMTGGMALTSLTLRHSYLTIICSYNIMSGMGGAMAYIGTLAFGMQNVPKSKGLVTGFIMASYGSGSLFFSLIQTNFINPNNYSPDFTTAGQKYFSQPEVLENIPRCYLLLAIVYGSLQLIGCILMCVAGNIKSSLIVIQTKIEPKETSPLIVEKKSPTGASVHLSGSVQYVEREWTVRELLCFNKNFYIIWAIDTFISASKLFVTTFYKTFGQSFIPDDQFLAVVGALASICNAVGRLGWGALGDHFPFKVLIVIITGLLTALSATYSWSALMPSVCLAKIVFTLCTCAIYLVFSGSYSLLPTAAAKSFGTNNVAVTYALLSTGAIFYQPLAALFLSHLGVYIGWFGIFTVAGGLSFIALILSLSFQGRTHDGQEV